MVINYSSAPNHFGYFWQQYIERGVPQGSFAKALLCNDAIEAVLRADQANKALIVEHFEWLWSNFPMEAWGNEGNYLRMLHEKGMAGVYPVLRVIVDNDVVA